MASSLMASQTLTPRSASFLSHRPFTAPSLPSSSFLLPLPSKPRALSLTKQPLAVSLCNPRPSTLNPTTKKLRVLVSASSSTIPNNPSIDSSDNPTQFLISESTRTIVSTIFAVALSFSRLLTSKIYNFALTLKGVCTSPSPEELATIQTVRESLVYSVGPLFFAALKSRPGGSLNTPLTVVAAGMSKWLDIYSGVLMVRVLLSWFPNIPWDRQPLSAIRDLCDPYLNLFRNIIPPIFDTLDVSPLLAFAVLGTLGSILNNSRGAY